MNDKSPLDEKVLSSWNLYDHTIPDYQVLLKEKPLVRYEPFLPGETLSSWLIRFSTINKTTAILFSLWQAIKQARKIYPLDDKLKMVDMELEHRRANEAYKSTKNSTPNN